MCMNLEGWSPWNGSRSADLGFPSQPMLSGFGEVWLEASLTHTLASLKSMEGCDFGESSTSWCKTSWGAGTVLARCWLSPAYLLQLVSLPSRGGRGISLQSLNVCVAFWCWADVKEKMNRVWVTLPNLSMIFLCPCFLQCPFSVSLCSSLLHLQQCCWFAKANGQILKQSTSKHV